MQRFDSEFMSGNPELGVLRILFESLINILLVNMQFLKCAQHGVLSDASVIADVKLSR
jgi:hypothetical protein